MATHTYEDTEHQLKIQLKSALDYIKILEKERESNPKCNRIGQPTDYPANPCHCSLLTTEKVNTSDTKKSQKATLSEQLDAAKDDNQILKKTISDLKEDYNLVKYQCKVFEEDFKKEQIERLNVSKKLAVVERELQDTRAVLEQYSALHAQTAADRRRESMQKIRNDYYRSQQQHYPYQSSYGDFVGRGVARVECDGEAADEDIIDSLVEPDDNPGIAASSCTSNTDLLCPKCNAGFCVDEHVAFIDHVDACRR